MTAPDSFPVAFGRYEMLERLAVGGMAEIYKARVRGAHGFQKPVVIKKILPHLAVDPSFVDMFIDEAKITARLDHPKIVQVLELGTIDENLYIAMEYVDGIDVLALLRGCAKIRQPLPPHLAVHIAHEVLDALEYAHAATDDSGKTLGIVHRDISPSNVLVSRRGDVKLTDFGIAHAVERQQTTQAGTLKGKYGYMSPEQVVGGDLDGRSDLFSVGIVLAEMLMGRRLFTAPNDLDVLLMVRDVRLERLDKYGKTIDAGLRAILDKAFAREAGDRYQTAREFRDALADWLFAQRIRVGPSDVASFVEFLFGTAKPKPTSEHPVAAGDKDRGTIAGPVTKAKEIEARRALARAREEAAPAQKRRESTEIPIVVDEMDEPEREAVQRALETAESGPLIIIEQGGQGDVATQSTQAAGAPPVDEADFSDLALELGIDDEEAAASSEPKRPPTPTKEDLARPVPPPPAVEEPGKRPDETGDFTEMPPLRLFYRLAVDKVTGLVIVEVGAITKEIYLTQGVPQYVSSNVARELLGEYLVAQKVINEGELAMALAMMPHFGGKLGDTLVGLGLLKPLDVFRHLTRQVRDKIVDVCTWHKGEYRLYKNARNPREAFPLGLDAFEVMGAGATHMPAPHIEEWAGAHLRERPTAIKNPKVVPEAFRLGSYPRDVYNKLTGRATTQELMGNAGSEDDRLAFLRTLYLLVHTDLAAFRG